MSVVIRVENLSKQYRRDSQPKQLRQSVGHILSGLHSTIDTPFYALNNVSFDIRKGECVGIVGRNGSGKTTLLRVLAGITQPTSGIAEVHGRFTALIALTAGFNIERTGRENIYLSAAIQCIAPKTVDGFIDDIIAFSELGSFIDTSVRHYSNGMTARLGFSIAVHLMPDIIFLDEILSVGDSSFQMKSFARIKQFKSEGRTLLIVSHDAALQVLAERTLWLDRGVLKMDGPTEEILTAYHQSSG